MHRAVAVLRQGYVKKIRQHYSFMPDLTLNEYKCFSENKIKKILNEEKRKLGRRDSSGRKIPAPKISALEKCLSKLARSRLIRRWVN